MPRRRDKPYNGDVDNPNITTRSSQGSNESTYNSPVNIMSVNGPVLEPLQSKITDITSPATSLLGMLKESGSMKADLNVTTNTQMLQKNMKQSIWMSIQRKMMIISWSVLTLWRQSSVIYS
jgi:hypothetical protein